MVQWIKFWALATIWGSSFLLIKVAVEDLGAFPLVSIRIGVAALLFRVYWQFTGRRFPTDFRARSALLFVGVFNTAVPFALISWGETRIDSGLATVLNSAVPLFNLVIAHFVLADERLSSMKIIGLGVGFLGVVVLMSGSVNGNADNPLVGQLAVIGASMSYAVSIVVIRLRLRHVDPLVAAGGSLMVGAIAIISVTWLTVSPLPDVRELEFKVMAAALTLAVVNTVLAYFLFYDLIDKWGVRASLVTYAMPPIGVTLGFLVLDETIDWRLIVGGAMILTGIVVAKINAGQTLPWRRRISLRTSQ